MEELPDYKKIKGILDRSFVYNFVVGKVDYNIKDVIRNSGDSTYISLYEEITGLRKLLFVFRLLRYDDNIPEIKLNVIHRNAELTKPLLRLFSYCNDSPNALNEVRLGLSKFILGRNESKKNSIESRLLESIKVLVKTREKLKEKNNGQDHEWFSGFEDNQFSNEQIRSQLRMLLEGKDIPGRSESFYSVEQGEVTYKRISSLYKSKFKAKSFLKRIDKSVYRGLEFSQDVLNRLDLYYNVPTEIEFVTDVTDVTHLEGVKGVKNDNSSDIDIENHAQITSDIIDENTEKDSQIPLKTVTSVTSVTDYDEEQEAASTTVKHDIYRLNGKTHCRNCKQTGDTPYMTIERPYCDCSLKGDK